jgi:hypothetical protein
MAKPVSNIAASKSSHVPQPVSPIGKKPVLGKVRTHTPPSRWCFSFRFWNQAEHFGLGGKDASWFISLIKRLQQISTESVDDFIGDAQKQKSMRYHKVNWGQTNIPIQRSNLEWLPTVYRNNDDDYPIYQFSISTGHGRIAGFWEENIFNVVLIDPYHNLQPSKEYDYKVTPTEVQLGEHELLFAKLNLIKCTPPTCSPGQCSTQVALNFLDHHNQSFGLLYLDAEYFKKANELILAGKVKTTADLVELGILAASS